MCFGMILCGGIRCAIPPYVGRYLAIEWLLLEANWSISRR